MDDDAMFLAYADALLSQMPCFRMNNSTRRNRLYLDPNLKGIIYHTIKFCDYYGFEYASIKRDIKVPLLKIETDLPARVQASFSPEYRLLRRRWKALRIWTHQKESARR